ncbi:MAG: DUF883 domain-containing protein [Rhodobacteraceae bacterium]|jgi:ElaB/YqjD/DUF883 family membrane-anchored ribosome-binding protein|uniref:DUF883 domain-containing protein n=1 Tax=Salipiger profundus TaxID=1229727 RepID=A0A1U7D6Y8_9RHOB|nr:MULTISPECIES: DUF883 family protein [Salipiger]APX23835.1 hypothetical protein Ga0080559_TMP3039 [Salipiger profundus]MAB07013.1 DUF883 domain-containing protein [Paracoccaceae bacterium]GGA18329.1 hypothetical protein GCM10011326_33660 [Salipiger profundus]SFD27759.1 Membrane-anchored ribosome-binding protein, inhibits growth in stationary phase, ElaB/YqjD/DUF883 family [Salipiger profundus]
MNQTTPTSAATASATTPKSGSERDLDALSKEIATLRRDLGSLTELVGDIGSRRGKEAKLKAEAKATEFRGRGEDALRDAGERLGELETNAMDQIRANPFQAVGIAAAAGFLIGYLGSRR